jgi:hypothetical protein
MLEPSRKGGNTFMLPTEQKTAVLISARPGLWRDALESLLKMDAHLVVIATGKEWEQYCCSPDYPSPRALLLEAQLYAQDLTAVLDRLQRDHPCLRSIIITDTAEQFQAARDAGIGKVCMKSVLHNQLDEVFRVQ